MDHHDPGARVLQALYSEVWNKPQWLNSQPQVVEYRTGEGRLSQKRVMFLSWVTMPQDCSLCFNVERFPRSTEVQRCLSIHRESIFRGILWEDLLLRDN